MSFQFTKRRKRITRKEYKMANRKIRKGSMAELSQQYRAAAEERYGKGGGSVKAVTKRGIEYAKEHPVEAASYVVTGGIAGAGVKWGAKQLIKKQFEHYLDPRQVAILQKNPEMLKLGGDRKEMSFLFSDIVGFTPISEHFKNKDDPEGLCELINDYLDRMTQIINNNGGCVDKYMGDCIMAFWNAPIPCENHAEMAVKSSIEIAVETELLKEELSAKGLPEIKIGSGVNTGDCIVGNMGSKTRFDYSCIGDAVNLAARLEAQTRQYPNCTTLYSSYTMEQLPDNMKSVEIDKVKVKGKDELVTIYSPLEY